MKVSKNWLKKHINISLSNQDLVDKLNATGTEVEDVLCICFDKIKVVEIEKISKHKNANKLKVVKVNDGKKTYDVVCGAKNYNVGDNVVLAMPGAVVSGFKIKNRKIKGIKSEGMLCSEYELGVGEDKSGIMVLNRSIKNGTNFSELYKADTIFSLDITPNRGDCLSHIGIAREIAAFSKETVSKDPISLKSSGKKSSEAIKLEVKNIDDCQRYYARVIEGVKIDESPAWLKDALSKMGVKSINNVVDVTNYILFDLGQPLHAFDLDKIKGRIVVRRSSGNESIITLDGEKRELSREDLVIADDKKPIAIAGVMGGKNTEVDQNTVSVVIEGAEFNRKLIRKTIKNLNLSTEASYRFERGIDSRGIEHAVNKATKLISEIAGGIVLSGFSSTVTKADETWIDIDYLNIRKYLGLDINNEEIKSLLSRLGFDISHDKCKAPSYRHDIEIWQDLAEEVGRIYGYEKIKPERIKSTKTNSKSLYNVIENIKDELVKLGLVEVYNYSFLSEKDAKIFNLDTKKLLEVKNPLQPENKYLRNSLKQGLLKNISFNSSFDPIEIFEIGSVFKKSSEDINLAIAVTNKSKIDPNEIEKVLLSKYRVNKKSIKKELLMKDVLKKYKIKKDNVMLIELNLSKEFENKRFESNQLVYSIDKNEAEYRPVSKYPSITRDIAIVVDKNLKSEEVKNKIYESSKKIKFVELFDEFSSDKLGVGKKSLAYHLSIQADDRTLSVKEGEKIFYKVVANLEKEFKAKLRA